MPTSPATCKDKSMADPKARHLSSPSKPRTAATLHLPARASREYDRPKSQSERVDVSEKAVSKDHRSFAANLFGTVAFKMLEWLTPRSIAAMSQRYSSLGEDGAEALLSASGQHPLVLNSTSSSTCSAPNGTPLACQASAKLAGLEQQHRGHDGAFGRGTEFPESCTLFKEGRSNIGSQDKQGTRPSANSNGPMFHDSLPPHITATNESKQSILTSRMSNRHPERSGECHDANNDKVGRGLAKMAAIPMVYETVSSPPPIPIQTVTIVPTMTNIDSEKKSFEKPVPDSHKRRAKHQSNKRNTNGSRTDKIDPLTSILLPQSLSLLNFQLVDFICDVFLEDGTLENHFVAPRQLNNQYPRPQNTNKALVRRDIYRTTEMKQQWKDFNIQSIFNVLSNPQATVQSFTQEGRLYDSHTLWYCLYRMVQVAPSLVFHSLWIAAGSLFAPSRSARRHQLPRAKFGCENHTLLSDMEAGRLLSICLHALVAAAPVIPDARSLYDMSRLRSNGLALASSSSLARQPASRCLDYNDSFSHELALRLARRLFCSISAHQYLKESRAEHVDEQHTYKSDILRSLIGHLDFLSTGSAPVLEFSPRDRLLHETRVPTILLDWARTVLLQEWDGRPDFTREGPFGGALSFIEALRKFEILEAKVSQYHTLTSSLRRES